MPANLADILMPQLPMEKTHQRLGIKNPFLKMMTDPFMIAGLVTGGLSGASAARKALKNRGVRKQLAAGFMPREAAEKTVLKGKVLSPDEPLPAGLSPGDTMKMGGMDVVKTGEPMRMFHGTQTPFGRVTQESVDAVPDNLYGPGHYQSSSGGITSEYALGKSPRGPSEGLDYAPNVRASFVDTRKPFDIERTYQVDDPDFPPELSDFLKARTSARRQRQLESMERNYRFAVRRSEDLEDMRRLAGKESDEDLLDDVMAVMEVQGQNIPIDEHPGMRDTAIALKNAIEDFSMSDKIMDAMDELMVRIGSVGGPGTTGSDLVSDPAIQQLLPGLRQTIVDIGEEAYSRPLRGPRSIAPPPPPQLTGQELFQSLKGASRELPSVRSDPSGMMDDIPDMPPDTESLAALLQGVTPSRYAKTQAGAELEMAREALKRSGFDSLNHLGGGASGGPKHLVNVAWDPKQVYLPYIADEMQRYRPEAAGGTLAALLGGTGAARNSRRR